jgi:glycosyltransferase involved in cell wall biosynthesis
MGRMHDVETLAGAISAGIPFGLKLRFHASGSGYARLRAVVPNPAVEWGGSLDDRDWQKAMIAAQVALVTMTPGAENVVMPSKTYSALVAGQAILAVCPVNSDLADLVREHDCGWVVVPGDIAALRAVLAEIASVPGILQAKRQHAYDAGHRFYDAPVLAGQWMSLFDSLS